MAEYKGKLLKGTYTPAKNVLLSDKSNLEEAIPRIYKKDITNEAVSTVWGGGYASSVITVPVTETLSTSNAVFVDFLPSTAAVAFSLISSVESDSVKVQLLRFSSGSVSGKINVLIK